MKASQDQYEFCGHLYDIAGPTAVYDYAKNNRIDSWSPCEPCDTDTPDTHDDCCLVCGSKKGD